MKIRISQYWLLYACAFAFVLTYSLLDRSYLFWADASAEYVLYRQIITTGTWRPDGGLLNACIFTTLLPAKLQPFSFLEPLLFFKIYIAMLVAFLPGGVYRLARAYGLQASAVVAPLFVMIQFHFARAPFFARMDIALAFWAFLLIALKEDLRYRMLIVMLASASMVLSHYGVAFIAFFVMAVGAIVKRDKRTMAGLGSLGVAGLVWYGFVATAPFQTLKGVVTELMQWQTPFYSGPGDFWHMGISVEWTNIAELYSFLAFWLALAVIIIGLTQYRHGRLIAMAAFTPMFAVYLFPYLEQVYGFIRFYFFASIALSPFFVHGLIWLRRQHPAFVVAAVFMILSGYALTDAAQAFAVGFVLLLASWYGLRRLVMDPSA